MYYALCILRLMIRVFLVVAAVNTSNLLHDDSDGIASNPFFGA